MISPSLMQSSHLSKWQHHSPGYVIYYPSKSCYFDTYCFFLLIFTAIIKVQGTVISFQFQNCCFQRLPRLPCSVLHTITRQIFSGVTLHHVSVVSRLARRLKTPYLPVTHTMKTSVLITCIQALDGDIPSSFSSLISFHTFLSFWGSRHLIFFWSLSQAVQHPYSRSLFELFPLLCTLTTNLLSLVMATLLLYLSALPILHRNLTVLYMSLSWH